jgi:hypothetical protein
MGCPFPIHFATRTESMAMLERIETAKRYLWAFVELGFVALLAILLIYMLLGQSSGEFVTSVADNVSKFATEASTSLIGIGIVLAIIYLISRRLGSFAEPDRPKSRSMPARIRPEIKSQPAEDEPRRGPSPRKVKPAGKKPRRS